MMQKLLAATILAMLASGPVRAELADCGFPPTYSPTIPDGTKATREEILAAVEAVKAYSKKVNEFLDCQEEGKKELFMVLTREQQMRWAEDFNELVDRLTEIETTLNEQIRAFNERS